jgi:hypothetical protein
MQGKFDIPEVIATGQELIDAEPTNVDAVTGSRHASVRLLQKVER